MIGGAKYGHNKITVFVLKQKRQLTLLPRWLLKNGKKN